ncbi:Uncharacterized protein SCF082_LOCUS44169 [Durusdinium trenchii]
MEAPEESEADPSAVSAYAEWLVNCLTESRQREEILSKEVTAVREAAAVGATALVELRGAVQAQLDSIARKLQSLQQELESTKLELAEVVIAKEEDGLELKQEVEVLRKNVETQKGLQHTQESHIDALEKKLLEASEREAQFKQHLEAKVVAAEDRVQKAEGVQSQLSQRVEECVVESKMNSLFEMFDKSMKAQLAELRQAQVDLEIMQQRSAQFKEEGVRRIVGMVEEHDRKLLGLDQRLSVLEETQQRTDQDLEQMRAEIQDNVQEKDKEALTTPKQGSVKIPSDTESRHASAGRGIAKAEPHTPASISAPVPSVMTMGVTPPTAPAAPTPAPAPAPATMPLTLVAPQNMVPTFTTESWRYSQAPQPQSIWAVSAGTGSVRRLSVMGTHTTYG